MPEPVITLCPNCGRRVHVEPYHERATCASCGQILQVQQPHGATGKRTARQMQAVAAPPAPEGQPAARTRALWLVLAPALAIAAAGTLILTVLPRLDDPAPPARPDFFGDASAIPDQLVRELGFPVMVQRMTIYRNHADVEVWSARDSAVHHYEVRPGGVQRRDSGEPDGSRVFDASELDVSRIPALVADALRRAGAAGAGAAGAGAAGARVVRIVVERAPEGPVRWHVYVDRGGEVYSVAYDGESDRQARPAR